MQASLSGLLLVLAVGGCAGQQQPPSPQQEQASAPQAPQCSQVGMASWYRGSSRDRVSPQDLVAAHRNLPFGTPVQVTDVNTGQSVVVRINDRGPFGRGRVIDLSRSAADQLGIRRDGVARVRLEWTSWNCPMEEARSN
jgi:rare lipoprotein A